MVNNSRIRSLRAAGLALTTLLISGGLAVQPAAADTVDIVPGGPQVLTPAPESPTDQFIVGMKDATAQSADKAARDVAGKAATALGAVAETARQNATGGHVIKLDKPLSAAESALFVKTLRTDPAIAYAEPDDIMHATADATDPGFPEQWNLKGPASINAAGAWDYVKGESVVVAVVDSGITRHEDLDANVVPGYDMISYAEDGRDGDGRDSDPTDQGDWEPAGVCEVGSPAQNSSWHGTHVAGIIAAVANNGQGITGVAPNAKILPVRALSYCGGYTSDIADSIIWAAGGVVTGAPVNPNPARVINLSLGGIKACSATYQNAINFAHNAGAAVVVSAGNSNRPAADASPANCENVITVAASNASGARAQYSNYGSAVDVTAPGGDMSQAATNGILSTFNFGKTTSAGSAYAWMQGTSMAAPQVAGLAALLISAEGSSLTPSKVEQQLKATSRPLPAGCPAGCGAGLVDANKALSTYGGTAPVNRRKITDFDGDSRSDVLARDSSGRLWLYAGDGYRGWLAARQIGSGWNGMTAIEAPGDFDGDGNADVLARDSSGRLWLYPGNGSGGWLAARQIGSGWNVMTAIEAPGDFNGDYKADVIARDSAGVLWLYPGNGSGGWLPARQIGQGWNVMTAIEGVGDFNGDGKADVVARNGAGALLLYPGNGSGGWFAAGQIGQGWNIMTAIESPGDFNGDGTVDLMGRASNGDLVLYGGNGSGGWIYATQVGSGWNIMTAIL
ncbi:S8 family serine peptidase [Arthrobacter sp. R3-55]